MTGHVLIVDDERNVRRVLSTLLEQAGYSTTPACSGEQALDLVRAQILLAAGGSLPVRQDEVSLRGHAIACRIAAEDPEREFGPCPGRRRAAARTRRAPPPSSA